jgi:lipopolysaccharide cholinephosphotransferase
MIESSNTQEQNLRLLQTELLKMLEEFDRKCRENGLKYYLLYGTMLGAVRHQGFIPWDDDVDLLMLREDLDRFVALFRDHYSDFAHLDGYNCRHYDSYGPNVRINSDRMMLRQDRDGKENYVSAFLSIWVADGLPDDPGKRKRHIKMLHRRYALLRLARSAVQGTQEGRRRRSKKEKILIALNKTLKIGKLIPPRKAAKWYNDCLRKYPALGGESCYIGWSPRGKRIYKTAWFESDREVSFEGLRCLVPSGFHEMLQMEYRSYMELPPLEKRVPRHGIDIKILE